MLKRIVLVLLAALPLAACPPRHGPGPGPHPGPDPVPGPNTPAPGPR